MPYIPTETPSDETPGFIYTVIAVTLFSWVYLYFFIANNLPENTKVILNGIFLFSLAITFTLSLILYSLKHKKGLISDARVAYRRSLKQSAYLGFGIGFLLIVKAFVLK